jgi:Mrp family chromosome partitioning ATPase
MSRNFELLYQVGKVEEMLQAKPETPPEVDTVLLPGTEMLNSVPALEIAGMVREELAKLVHRLFLIPGTKGPHYVVFTGTEMGNGCTWMCAHAGEILASQIASSVCIVDCNWKSPSLHEQFGIENHYGLTDALLGHDPIVQYARRTSRQNLWVVSSGLRDENSQALLTSDRMRARISELRSKFDYVLMDVAPLNICSHGVVFGGLSDGVVLVLKANSSRRDSTREMVQQFEASNVRMLGAVLNQRTFPIPEQIYNRL